jgi:uncharacterized membrane protein YccC
VLRSNALGTGATIVQAVVGTALGIVVGGLLVVAIGAEHALLWAVLPFAVFLAAYAPRAISFTAGQAGFTVVLVVLFNIIQPVGWTVGLVRVEDVAIGFAISLVVGLLLWPRGARAALRDSVAEAYATSADYLAAAATAGETGDAQLAAGAATRRLDDTYRQFLAERGHEDIDMGSVSRLVTGATQVRLAAYALETMAAETGRWEASPALSAEASAMHGWYLELAEAIRRVAPSPLPEATPDGAADDALRRLDRAVHADDMGRIRTTLGAALASEQIADLRGFEAKLASALDALPSVRGSARGAAGQA